MYIEVLYCNETCRFQINYFFEDLYANVTSSKEGIQVEDECPV